MNRRDFLVLAGLTSASWHFLKAGDDATKQSEAPHWRTFEVTTRAEILKYSGTTRIWLPMPLTKNTEFQKTLHIACHAESPHARISEYKTQSPGIILVEFPPGVTPRITAIYRVATRDWSVDLDSDKRTMAPRPSNLEAFLQPTQYVPTDGIVRQKALEITKSGGSDVDRARAIYEWIVQNTYRKPKVQGCGRGEIRFMLESGDFGGKCADLNGLFVGLARAAGIPARDAYGIRLAKSEKGYKSLGAQSDTVTKAQHCRAEVFLSRHGWVPVDPADVRKVILEEPPGNLQIDNPMVSSARNRLFGSWEMNWMAYNYAQDVSLPKSDDKPLHFLMYPQAESSDGWSDSLDPDHFSYEISSREITSGVA